MTGKNYTKNFVLLYDRFDRKWSTIDENAKYEFDRYFYDELVPKIRKLDRFGPHEGGQREAKYFNFLFVYSFLHPDHRWVENDPVFKEAREYAKNRTNIWKIIYANRKKKKTKVRLLVGKQR